jgi:hypothetical protein
MTEMAVEEGTFSYSSTSFTLNRTFSTCPGDATLTAIYNYEWATDEVCDGCIFLCT